MGERAPSWSCRNKGELAAEAGHSPRTRRQLSAATPNAVGVQGGSLAHRPPCSLLQNDTGMLSITEINCKQGQSCVSVQRACAPGTPITARETGCFCSAIAAGTSASPATGQDLSTLTPQPSASLGPATPQQPASVQPGLPRRRVTNPRSVCGRRAAGHQLTTCQGSTFGLVCPKAMPQRICRHLGTQGCASTPCCNSPWPESCCTPGAHQHLNNQSEQVHADPIQPLLPRSNEPEYGTNQLLSLPLFGLAPPPQGWQPCGCSCSVRGCRAAAVPTPPATLPAAARHYEGLHQFDVNSDPSPEGPDFTGCPLVKGSDHNLRPLTRCCHQMTYSSL